MTSSSPPGHTHKENVRPRPPTGIVHIGSTSAGQSLEARGLGIGELMAVPTAWMLLSELTLCRSKLCGPPLRWSSVAGDTNLQRENRNWGSAGRVMGMAGTRRRGAAVSGLGLVAVHLGSRHFKYATTQEATSRAGGLLPASLCLYSTPTRCCRSALLCPWEVGALPDALLFFS